MVGVRGIASFDATLDANGRGWRGETLAWPYLMKAPVVAWDSGLIFDRPAVEPNYTVQFIWVDQCADLALGSASDYCKMPYSIELHQDLYFGNAQTGLPRSKVVLGSYLFTEKLAYFSSMQKTPMVGWASGNMQLSAKDDFPNFRRVNSRAPCCTGLAP